MPVEKNVLMRVRGFLKECRDSSIPIEKAILFGSAANNEKKYTDIDMALFSSEFSDNILKNLDIIGKINIRYPEIDVHTYPSPYSKQKGIVLDRVKKTGIEIKL